MSETERDVGVKLDKLGRLLVARAQELVRKHVDAKTRLHYWLC